MFGVGLHFHVSDLREVGGIAIPGALVQSSVATLLGLGIGVAFGWPVASGLVLGMALSVASTVVLLRGLEAHNLVGTPAGHAAIGWLIVEDILTVVVLVVIPVLGQAGGVGAGSGGLPRGAGAGRSASWSPSWRSSSSSAHACCHGPSSTSRACSRASSSR